MSTPRPDFNSQAGRHSRRRHNHHRMRIPRWASLISGGALAALGISRRSWTGAALAAGGGLLFYNGLRSGQPQAVHVQLSMTINKPVHEVWQFWRRLDNLPRFMTHLESVKTTSDRYSYWTAYALLGGTVSWHAEITDERENQFIVWRSLPGSDVENAGSVQFRPAPADRGTEVHVAIDYRPVAGKLGDAVASLFGRSLEQQVREDLRHFKQLMEGGEIPTTEGQPHGQRSAKIKAAQRIWREPEVEPSRFPRTA